MASFKPFSFCLHFFRRVSGTSICEAEGMPVEGIVKKSVLWTSLSDDFILQMTIMSTWQIMTTTVTKDSAITR